MRALRIVLAVLAFSAVLAWADNIGFENGIPTGWTTIGVVGVANSSSGLNPYQGNSFAYVSNHGLRYSALVSPVMNFDDPELISIAFSYLSQDGGPFYDPAMMFLLPAGTSLPTSIASVFPSTLGSTDAFLSASVLGCGLDVTGPNLSENAPQFLGNSVDLGAGGQFGPKRNLEYAAFCPGYNPQDGRGEIGGSTDWITTSFVAPAGSYQLVFVASNAYDTIDDSALAIGDIDVKHVKKVEEPSSFLLLLAAIPLVQNFLSRRRS